ncbi:SGNH/GDSL hydrolase family protein [Cellulomonas sp. ACRRI]|uniref:SGNH/GDSL hydrolase family protein n=1 Tax=Cellulomonas sp. ACRRI TaxID=2918188 RepID=UPI001EF300C8|nr:SGNH/GDSL hydrolase family protein [Cellulomonas sp. ACRRI]MCG7284813.1 SGNH/GDSL hydrolase family protein [Cellulomonas sp. ACRRI]
MTRVQYAVDVSGSTESPVQDCTGDGVIDALDDLNGDGRRGDVLDCQIAAVVALNASLRTAVGSAERVEVGLTAFGTTAATAQMRRDDPSALFVPPGLTGEGTDVVPNVNHVAASLRRGAIGEYADRSVGTGTSFDAALTAALDALALHHGPGWVFLLSDGQATVSAATLDRVARSGVSVRTFAVGGGTGAAPCAASAPLGAIAAAGSDSCVRVTDPSALTASVLDSRPAWIDTVTVDVGGRRVEAEVDAIGGWTVTVPGLAETAHTAVVRARFTDGLVLTERVPFWVTGHLSYVALGDSFASGEGLQPYLHPDVDPGATVEDYICHRSGRGWPAQVVVPGGTRPVAHRLDAEFDFGACTGARIVNLDSEQQRQATPYLFSDEQKAVPLQLDRLGSGADLVTVSIGGNDLGFAPIVGHCIKPWFDRCWDDAFVTSAAGTKVSLHDWMTVRLALVGGELTGVYRGIRDRVGPDATVVATTYPRLVSASPFALANLACHAPFLDGSERRWLRDRIDVFAAIVQDRAARPGAGLQVVDVRDDFEGRNACDWGAAITGFSLRAVGGPEFGLTFSTSFHPNQKGADLYAQVVNDALAHSFRPPRFDAATEGADVADPVERAGAAAGQAATVSRTVSATADDQAPGFDPRIVTDPEAVLREYPEDVVSAVGSLTFAQSGLGNAAATDGYDACDEVVPGEIVPFGAHGFAPGSEVTVTATSVGLADGDDHGTSTTATHRADDLGGVQGTVVVPPFGSDGAFFVSFAGTNSAGGAVVGDAMAPATVDAACRAVVEEAGHLAGDEDEGADTPGADRTEPAVARDPVPGGAVDPSGRDLSMTGGALVWTAAAAVALLLAGATARVLFRRRTGSGAAAGGS